MRSFERRISRLEELMAKEAVEVWQRLDRSGVSLWIGPDFRGGWAGQVKPKTQNVHELVERRDTPLQVIIAADALARSEWPELFA
jgi:hypothetical protein